MKRRQMYYKQNVSEDEMNELQSNIEIAIGNILSDFLVSNGVFLKFVYPTCGSNSWTLNFPANCAYVKDNPTREWLVPIRWSGLGIVNCQHDKDGNSVVPSSGNKRYIAVLAKFSRAQYNQKVDGHGNIIYYNQDEWATFEVWAGAESASPSRVSVPSYGYALCAEALLNSTCVGLNTPVDWDFPNENELDLTNVKFASIPVSVPNNGMGLFGFISTFDGRRVSADYRNICNGNIPTGKLVRIIQFSSVYGGYNTEPVGPTNFKPTGKFVIHSGITLNGYFASVSNYYSGTILVAYKNSTDNYTYIAALGIGENSCDVVKKANFTVTTYQDSEVINSWSGEGYIVLYNNASGDTYKAYIAKISNVLNNDLTLGSVISIGNYGTRPSIAMINQSKLLVGIYNNNAFQYILSLWDSNPAKLGSDLAITVAYDVDNSYAFTAISDMRAVLAYVSGASIIIQIIDISGNTPALVGTPYTWSIDGKGLRGSKSMRYLGSINGVAQIIIAADVAAGTTYLRKFNVSTDSPSAIGSDVVVSGTSSVISLEMPDNTSLILNYLGAGLLHGTQIFDIYPDTVVNQDTGIQSGYFTSGERPSLAILPGDMVALVRGSNTGAGVVLEMYRQKPAYGSGIIGVSGGSNNVYPIRKFEINNSVFSGLTTGAIYSLSLFGDLRPFPRRLYDQFYRGLGSPGYINTLAVGIAESPRKMRFLMEMVNQPV